ncbi:MAG: iron-sulfur cluster assembly accessory protein [Cyanobacteria bacterium P01_D01_bin.105]
MIQLTPAACQEINRLRVRQGRPSALCRLDLQPSECAQWAYVLSLEDVIAEDDDVHTFDSDGGDGLEVIQVVVKKSDRLSYIQGLQIDFSEDLQGGAFRFDNPQATESCRCGYAFAIR